MRNLLSDKKGQIFTLVAIALAGLLFVTFQVHNVFEQRQTIQTRVSTMDNFLHSLEDNIGRQLYISGFRVIFLAEDEIATTGEYIGDFGDFFSEAFNNGTVAGEVKEIMVGATRDDLIASINQKANKINVEVSFSNISANYTQVSPWNVRFIFSFNFIVEDSAGLVRWERPQEIITDVPIEGFEDPLYLVNTNALISRIFNRTIYEGNYVDGADIGNLLSHVNGGLYSSNSDAPSFIKRLEGDLTPDENGIESFVILPELDQQGIPISVKSTIDYIYF